MNFEKTESAPAPARQNARQRKMSKKHCGVTMAERSPGTRGARTYHNLRPSHKTCNSPRMPLLSALEAGLQSRWVVNAG